MTLSGKTKTSPAEGFVSISWAGVCPAPLDVSIVPATVGDTSYAPWETQPRPTDALTEKTLCLAASPHLLPHSQESAWEQP